MVAFNSKENYDFTIANIIEYNILIIVLVSKTGYGGSIAVIQAAKYH